MSYDQGGRSLRVTRTLLTVLTDITTQDPKPVYGYGVCVRLGRPTGVVYPVLRRLLRHEYLMHVDTVYTNEGPARRYYAINPEQRASIDALLERRTP